MLEQDLKLSHLKRGMPMLRLGVGVGVTQGLEQDLERRHLRFEHGPTAAGGLRAELGLGLGLGKWLV